MGIYYDHGVEYRFIINNSVTIICPSRSADQRLVESNYYLSQKNNWFNMDIISSLLSKPKKCDPDIQLNEFEMARLKFLLNDYPDGEHGWFEVASYTTSY